MTITRKSIICSILLSIATLVLVATCNPSMAQTNSMQLRVMTEPSSDKEEAIVSLHSDSITSIKYVGYSSKSIMDFTIEVYKDGHQEVVAIPFDIYPSWVLADKLEGYKARGTYLWLEVAKGK